MLADDAHVGLCSLVKEQPDLGVPRGRGRPPHHEIVVVSFYCERLLACEFLAVAD